MTKRTLNLKSEQISDLTTGELTDVVAGADDAGQTGGPTCPLRDCVDGLTRRLTCYCTLVC